MSQTQLRVTNADEDESSFTVKLTGDANDSDYESSDEEEQPSKSGRGKTPGMRPSGIKSKSQHNKFSGKGVGKTVPRRYGGKGLGKGNALRHKRPLKDNIMGITKPAIRRLARRGGVKRISCFIYDEIRDVLKEFLSTVIEDAVTYTEHAKRKTVMTKDVMYSLKRNGKSMYGFGK